MRLWDDPFFSNREPIFDANLAEFSVRVVKMRDYSFPALVALRQARSCFDLICIDGNHEREAVMLDSILSWPMLRNGGLLIWDDYRFYKAGRPLWERPTSAIDGFLLAYQGEYEKLSSGEQMVVRKVVESQIETRSARALRLRRRPPARSTKSEPAAPS